ncbi:fatty-acyl-CoA synthase [Actinomadura sp. NBRC 104412]|uniref:acyl-CoA synthetase n=1 Tax=Actinomadura sp. NBRC 104412 TaxID=3032203 RepID=UPI0024A0F2D0|nr:acyl-CoA synthetase [Actinomadura sp. NBRC 104412]GLZ03801.1 fatty-acyl-CoA synthase [Actinomadura sp. NBRC 104412]
MEFNHADLFEGVADAVGDRVALVCGDRRLTYAELDAEANRLAHHLESVGVEPGRHVAMQMYNCVEYAIALLAVLKIRAVPINVNYRYVRSELLYLYRDSDSVALLYDAEFDERVAETVSEVPGLRHYIVVGGESSIPGAVTYEEALAGQPDTRGFGPRSEDDTYIIYTGGTTGMPKGVMWTLKNLLFGFWNPALPRPGVPQDVVDNARNSGPLVMMAAAPLMHGAAQLGTWIGWFIGATLVYVRRFDAAEVWRAVEREKVNSMTITGDAMAIPMVEELERGGSYDLSSLITLASTGAILTGTVRDRLAAALPNVIIMDRFGSTESGSTAEAVAGSTPEKGLRFAPDVEDVAVLNDALQPVKPGSGVIGQVARTGYIASGYYNDPEKTAKTFPVAADGVRWLLTGDIATVDEDGSIAVYGRGSQAINTGGEKVFPEEVEAVLKGHPSVFDAVVTGIPDERFGHRVAAVIQPHGETPSTKDLDAHCRKHLSGYKVPRSYAFVEEMQRSPAGKADYRWAKQVAQQSAD